MKQKLIETAEKIGVSAIGFTQAEVYTDLRDVLLRRKTVFADGVLERRFNPFLILPGAKSVIVLLCSYYTGKQGNISAYAHGRDYHRVMAEKCAELCAILEKEGYTARAFCDTGDLCERYLAWRAGLGVTGRNGFLISPRFGTYVFIAHIVTDCPLPPDKPTDGQCAGCGACIAACPGGALGENGSFLPERCLSYITQKKGELTPEETALMQKSGCAWGCDVCQMVCPHNRDIEKAILPDFTENLISELVLQEGMSNREFKLRYGDRAFAWRGKAVLLRNLRIVQN